MGIKNPALSGIFQNLSRLIFDQEVIQLFTLFVREAGVQEADFLAHVDKLSEDAFDDQCTGANPRYPLISELKQILLDTYYGRNFTESDVAAVKVDIPAVVKADKKAKKNA